MKTLSKTLTAGIVLTGALAFAQNNAGQATGGGETSSPEALSGQNPSTGGSMTGPGRSGTTSQDSQGTSKGKKAKSGKHTNTGNANSNSGGATDGTSNQDTPAHGSH